MVIKCPFTEFLKLIFESYQVFVNTVIVIACINYVYFTIKITSILVERDYLKSSSS